MTTFSITQDNIYITSASATIHANLRSNFATVESVPANHISPQKLKASCCRTQHSLTIRARHVYRLCYELNQGFVLC